MATTCHLKMMASWLMVLLVHPLIIGASNNYGIPQYRHAFVTSSNSNIKLFASNVSGNKGSMKKVSTLLASTTAKNNNSPSPSSSTTNKQQRNYHVLYQKVLRAPPPPKSSSSSSSSSHATTFLLDLITYLQDVFELPRDLPMPYELVIPNNDNDEDDDNEEYDSGGGDGGGDDNRAILIIDSPLSNTPHEARLEIEVIGIFPDNVKIDSGPTMAMVALKKCKDPNSDNNSDSGVTQGLFAASETKIVSSLDRGLQDLEEGRIALPQSSDTTDDSLLLNDDVVSQFDNEDDGVDKAMKRIAYKNAIDAASSSDDATKSTEKKKTVERKEEQPLSIERDGLGNVIIDSVASSSQNKKKVKKEKKDETKTATAAAKVVEQSSPRKSSEQPKKLNGASQSKQSGNNEDDYAIQMARKQAEALMTTVKAGDTTSSRKGTIAISGGEGDFAILAAKRAAAAASAVTSRSNGNTAQAEKPIRGTKESLKGQQAARITSPITNTVPKKGKVQDLSNDDMYQKLNKIANMAKQSGWKRTIPKNTKSVGAMHNMAKDGGVGGGIQSSDTANSAAAIQEKEAAALLPTNQSNEKTDDEIMDDVMKIALENEQVQRELKVATDMMPIEKEGEDEGMSPEEMLADILKFGEEKEKEEKPGYGFVEGALGKAKELLGNEEGSASSQASFNEVGFKDGNLSADEMKRRAEEEELKRIFAVGQSVAEDRLSKKPTTTTPRESNMANPTITEEDINALIDADDTVPRNARVLDDELAEFEVRMSKENQEGGEKQGPNKMFDVFSGPEVYNPNVDPETAVNWPGAKEGTRTNMKLAADLSTALKQAQFASAVLSQMRVVEEEVGEENNDGGGVKFFVGTRELQPERVTLLRNCVNEAVKAGIIEDPEIILAERARLQMLVDELVSQPMERLEDIAMNYKDLLLSDNLVGLIKERLQAMALRDVEARGEGKEDMFKGVHANERAIMINLAQIGQGLVKEAQALGAELEVSMLEIIRSICEVAMDPSHKDEADTAVALTDAVRDMRPLLDDAFVAYLKYAIAEEEGKLARAGLVDDPEHNRWLFVLRIVQEGVYTELSSGVKRYVDHLLYVLRMKSKTERKELLKKLIDVMPTMDVRPFVKVVNNIVSSLGTTVKGDFEDGVILGEMTNQLLQLQRDVNELLPPERIDELSKDADSWAAKQRQRLLERRNMTKQRLEAARQTGDIDPDKIIKKPGVEAERFD